MFETSFLHLFWFCFVALVFLTFFLLDGFDMGIGMMLPFFSKKKADRKVLLDVTWPFWDGNELWAIIGGACLFAAFPYVFVGLLGGLAPVLALLLSVLMLRTVSFEAWYKDPKRARAWEWAQAVGSGLLAFAFGLVMGNLLSGLPFGPDGRFTGDFRSAVHIFPVLTGLLAVAAAYLHGAVYLRKKTNGDVKERADALAKKAFPYVAAMSALVLVWLSFMVPEALVRPMFYLGVLGAVLCAGLCFRALKADDDAAPFYWSAGFIASVWIAGLSALFPYIVRPVHGGTGLLLDKAASPDSTLGFLAVFGVVALAIVACYTIFAYRVFKGKADPNADMH